MAIDVKLRLGWQEFRAEVDRAAAYAQSRLGNSFGGGGAGGLATNPASTTSAILDPNHGKPVPSQPPSVAKQVDHDRARFIRNFGFAALPLLNPTSIFGNLFASRQIFSALSGTKTGQNLLSKFGLGGSVSGAVVGTAAIMAILLPLGVAFKGLQAAVKETTDAFKYARSLYAKSLLSGLGTSFTQQRLSIAQVLGISERDVFQFGAAMAYLQPRLAWANKTIAETNPELATTAVQFEVMKQNIRAAASAIGSDFAPAIRKMIDVINDLVIETGNWFKELNSDKWQAAGAFAAAMGIHATRTNVGAPIQFSDASGKLITGKAATELAKKFEEFTKNFKSGSKDLLPAAQGMMKQLPVSALERMGLVIGGFGGSQDYSRRIAVATEKTARGIAQLAQKGVGFRANQFGMSTTTSNP